MKNRRFARCIDNSDFSDIEIMEGYVYEIFSEKEDMYLIIDEYDELTYIPKYCFSVALTLIEGGLR